MKKRILSVFILLGLTSTIAFAISQKTLYDCNTGYFDPQTSAQSECKGFLHFHLNDKYKECIAEYNKNMELYKKGQCTPFNEISTTYKDTNCTLSIHPNGAIASESMGNHGDECIKILKKEMETNPNLRQTSTKNETITQQNTPKSQSNSPQKSNIRPTQTNKQTSSTTKTPVKKYSKPYKTLPPLNAR